MFFMLLLICVTVESIRWVRPDGMLVAYTETNEDGEEVDCPLLLLASEVGDLAKVHNRPFPLSKLFLQQPFIPFLRQPSMMDTEEKS